MGIREIISWIIICFIYIKLRISKDVNPANYCVYPRRQYDSQRDVGATNFQSIPSLRIYYYTHLQI